MRHNDDEDNTQEDGESSVTLETAATKSRSFRTFLLMQQFEQQAIGARIAQARKEQGGMTQEQLADLLNVSKRSVQEYEAGNVVPWKHFQQMATILKRPVEWFLHGEDDPAGTPAALVAALQEIDSSLGERLAQLEATVETLTALLHQLVARFEQGEPVGRQERATSTADRTIQRRKP